MCAINGFTFRNEELIRKMDAATLHRGPDGTRIWGDEHVTLGHNRLAIIDLSFGANQPMKSNDGRLTIVFNGEIYNYLELRSVLEDDYHFNTKSDTEVILAAYQKWGKECLKHFNGIFAFAVWNAVEQELFLARDHAGIKPLYYYYDRDKLIFSSEIKAILEHDVDRKINLEAVSHYFRLLYVPEPLTMFKGIWKLPGGSYAVHKNHELSIISYLSKKRPDYFQGEKQELREMIVGTIDKAVKRQLLTSDRPVGIYLSGGIDSNIILDAASRIKQKIDTFSVGFELTPDEQPEKFNRDLELARKSAEIYGTRHHEILLQGSDVLSYFEKAIFHLDEPVSNPTELAMLKLAELATKSVTVTLGGDGGDELFGGYERYRLSALADRYQKTVPGAFRKFLATYPKFAKLDVLPSVDRYALFMFQKDEILSRILAPQLVGESTKEFFREKYFFSPLDRPFEETFMDVDRVTWLRDESLVRTDKMAMASGIEARVPFLDKEVIALAERIPGNHKVTHRDTKRILKEAFGERLPQHLFNEPKRGWFSPAAKWLRRSDVSSYVHTVLNPSYYPPIEDLFNWEEVLKIVEGHEGKKEYNLTLIWSLLTFILWARTFRASV